MKDRHLSSLLNEPLIDVRPMVLKPVIERIISGVDHFDPVKARPPSPAGAAKALALVDAARALVCAESGDDVRKRLITDVDRSTPSDGVRIELGGETSFQVVIDDGCQQIVRRRNCVHVASEVQVDIVTRQ